MDKKYIISIDGLGGDDNIVALYKAISMTLIENKDIYYLIYGNDELKDLLLSNVELKDRYSFFFNNQKVEQDANVRLVLKNYTKSSLSLCIQDVKYKRAHVAFSAGGTGPLVSLARHILGDTGLRPALVAKIPTINNDFSLMLDLGANAKCKGHDLFDFALLANDFYRKCYNIHTPRIAILNVGSEYGKGNDTVQSAKEYIMECKTLNFIGFIEGNDLLCHKADIIVTEGFTGNIALKVAEGVGKIFLSTHKDSSNASLNPSFYNGSLLLGVNGLVVKSHASAQFDALYAALNESYKLAHKFYN